MKTASKTAVTAVAFMLVAGCGHKVKVVPPPQAQAPSGPPSSMTYVPPMPELPPPALRPVEVANTAEKSPPPPPAPRRTSRHRSAPAKTASSDATAQPVEKPSSQPAPATNAAPEVSSIGQLSSTGESVSSQGRHEIEQLIAATESGLNNLKRPLSAEEQVTSTQIKTFLSRAKQALSDNDLDGAQTLATKAKVLLDELTKK